MRGQGSVEYLLLLGLVISFLAAIAIVSLNVLKEPQAIKDISQEKADCGLDRVELMNYDETYGGTSSNNPGYLLFSIRSRYLCEVLTYQCILILYCRHLRGGREPWWLSFVI